MRRWGRLAAVGCACAMCAALASAAMQRADRPDLVERVSDPPGSTLPGARIRVVDQAKNAGARTAKESVTRFYLSRDRRSGRNDVRLVGRRLIPALKPGEASRGRSRVLVPGQVAPAGYWLLACADDRKRVRERVETNNCRASSTRISVQAPPVVGDEPLVERVPDAVPEPEPTPAPEPAPEPDPAPAPDPDPTPEPEPEPPGCADASCEAFVWQTECGGVVRNVAATVGSPAELDVCGDASPDVRAAVALTAAGRAAEITKLAGAGQLPLRIEAVTGDPRVAGGKVAWGVDATAFGAPESLRAEIDLSAPSRNAVRLEVVPAGGALGVTAETFTAGDAGERLAPWRMRADLASAPPSVTIDPRFSGAGVEVSLGAGAPTRVELLLDDLSTAAPRRMQATVDQVSAAAHLSFGEQSARRTLNWVAAAATGRVELHATGLPLTGRARQADFVLQSVPSSLALDLGIEGGPVELDAGGASLGSLNMLLTSAPVEAVPAGSDGFVLRDLADRYVLAARVSGLQRIVARPNPLDVVVDTSAGNVFRGDMQQAGTPAVATTFVLDDAPTHAAFAVDDTGGMHRVVYSGTTAEESLQLVTNAGPRHSMTLSAAPLPTAFALCDAPGPGCATPPASTPGNRGSVRMTASAATRLVVSDCRVSSTCPERLTADLTLRKLDLQVDTQGTGGNLWFDTDNLTVTGTAASPDLRVDHGAVEIEADFPAGTLAQNRVVSWTSGAENSTGTVTCPAGTNLDVTVSGSLADLTSRLC